MASTAWNTRTMVYSRSVVVFDSNGSAQLLDAAERQRLREQISRISLCWNLHHIQPAFIPCCLQQGMSRVHLLRQPESLTCGVVHHSLAVACDRHTRVVPEISKSTLETKSPPLQLIPQHVAQLSHDERDSAFCFVDQNLKSPPLWTSIPPLTELLFSRFAAQSLSV